MTQRLTDRVQAAPGHYASTPTIRILPPPPERPTVHTTENAACCSTLRICRCIMFHGPITSLDLAVNDSCQSFYRLSKSLLQIDVSIAPNPDANSATIKLVRIPDARRRYCLDYLRSPISDNPIVIKKSASGLLETVSSSINDGSKEIPAAIKTAFETLKVQGAAPADAIAMGKRKTLRYEFDPLDTRQLLLVNSSLRSIGLCVFLREASSGKAVQHTRSDVQIFCGNKLTQKERERAWNSRQIKTESVTHGSNIAGILYRPLKAYTLYVLKRQNRVADNSAWLLMRAAVVEIENASPILSIDVRRALFDEREATLSFEEGVLRDVEIKKGSGAQSIVDIPLSMVRGVVSLPSQIIRSKIGRTSTREELTAAQTRLLNAHKSLYQALSFGGAGQQMSKSHLSRRLANSQPIDSCIADCVQDVGRDEARCLTGCTCDIHCQARENPQACRMYCREPAQQSKREAVQLPPSP